MPETSATNCVQADELAPQLLVIAEAQLKKLKEACLSYVSWHASTECPTYECLCWCIEVCLF